MDALRFQHVSELHVLKWYKNLRRRVWKFDTADESRSEEMGRRASDVSNLWAEINLAFCYRVSEAFLQEIWEEPTSNQTGGSKFNRNLKRT